ncbi:uncharacterized protein LOC128264268 [Drosophila gunungcola]|uniref:uncharacterized protein LOC128264266 n=1 Tax=Drosophila gunungcola TaxID=103775 RepID=UPI0022E4B65B|nr:uncharacterized protein LOC128264266 [Drosophila gunungcola]XP_052855637.1 uncharacterized protein LOC128264267 [Drosophila gunungcola]XP_052855638.1 uncharacterized protein LOC128264268 [Drosophila gunungcola]
MQREEQEKSQPLTSEVGWAQAQRDSEWRSLLEAQNLRYIEILKTMQQPASTNSSEKLIRLPKFNPDVAEADASAWRKTADMIFTEHPLEGSALVMSLSGALEGSASQWLAQISYAGITWPKFQELFVLRYDNSETPAAILLNIRNGRPKTGECLSAYGSRLVTSLLTKWKAMDIEEIAVSFVLAHTSQIDTRLQRLLFTTNITNRNELQQQLKAYAYRKQSEHLASKDSIGPQRKRFKANTSMKCHYCGISGHKMLECRKRKAEQSKPSQSFGKPLAGRDRT